MTEIKVTVDVKCPDLVEAAKILAGIQMHAPASAADPTAPMVQTAPVSAPAISTPAVQTAPSAAVAVPVPVTTAPAVPVAAAPTYTVDQIGRAGAELLAQTNGAAMPQLMALLQKYGVSSADMLKQDQLGAFATELRGLGAKL